MLTLYTASCTIDADNKSQVLFGEQAKAGSYVDPTECPSLLPTPNPEDKKAELQGDNLLQHDL